MITTPQAELERLAAYIYGWKETVDGYDFAQARVDAQAVIDLLLTDTRADTVLGHPSTRWLANRFMVSWYQASLALVDIFPPPTPPAPPGFNFYQVELVGGITDFEVELAAGTVPYAVNLAD